MLITVFSVYGGIYLDWDEIMLQPIDDLRKHDYVQVSNHLPMSTFSTIMNVNDLNPIALQVGGPTIIHQD